MENHNHEKTNHFITGGSYCIRGGFRPWHFYAISLASRYILALFAAWFLAMAVGKRNGFSYQEMEHAVTKGIYDGMSAILILLAVGALVGTWISGGIVPSLIYYGLKVIHPSIFLLATLILCSITSIATGTSWGTVGTSGIAMMGIGSALEFRAPATAGSFIRCIFTGDKLSPLSDSCVLSAAMADIDVIDHVRGILPVSLSAFGITGIAFTVLGFRLGGGSADMTQVNSVMAALQKIFISVYSHLCQCWLLLFY